MITGSTHLKFEYEHTRLNRYASGTRSVYWAYEEVLEAYNAWAKHPYGRERQWDTYCDMRDGVPRGTNAKIRKKREADVLH